MAGDDQVKSRSSIVEQDTHHGTAPARARAIRETPPEIVMVSRARM
jgi:hypothetical protein